MKILSLNIGGTSEKNYKNLRDLAIFDFSNCTNHVALIGLNGSGKSNILEAISLIFSSLYQNKPAEFKYEIVYQIGQDTVSVVNGEMKVAGKNNISKKNIAAYLPSNVITSYSGEELRLWEEIYIDSYSDFFQDIKAQTSFVPKLLYINKYCWEFSLIALLCSENPIIQNFTKKILKIESDVEIEFTIDENNFGLYGDNEALSLIRRIVELQKDSKNNSVHINEINTLDIKQKDNSDFTKKLFYYLFITAMPMKSDRIKANKIIKKINLKFNGIDVKKLSEGEKKLILIHTITNLLADDKTLVLLDEPDAHVHISRKKEIVEVIANDSTGCFTIFTTHSPTILHCIKDENIRIIKSTQEKGLEVVFIDKIKALEEITNGNFSIIDATLVSSTSKDILLVEGTNDYDYLTEALERFKTEYHDFNFLIINCGGADNVPAVLEQSILPILSDNQLCICAFDYDGQGRINYAKVEQIADSLKKKNIQYFYHPHYNHSEHSSATGDYYMEDYFSIDSYRNIIKNNLGKKNKFKDFEQGVKAKSIIENNYKHFDNNDYLNFKIFLNHIIEIQNVFHKLAHSKEIPIPSGAMHSNIQFNAFGKNPPAVKMKSNKKFVENLNEFNLYDEFGDEPYDIREIDQDRLESELYNAEYDVIRNEHGESIILVDPGLDYMPSKLSDKRKKKYLSHIAEIAKTPEEEKRMIDGFKDAGNLEADSWIGTPEKVGGKLMEEAMDEEYKEKLIKIRPQIRSDVEEIIKSLIKKVKK